MEIFGADFFDWLCDSSDVNKAFKLDEVADLRSIQHSALCSKTENKNPEAPFYLKPLAKPTESCWF